VQVNCTRHAVNCFFINGELSVETTITRPLMTNSRLGPNESGAIRQRKKNPNRKTALAFGLPSGHKRTAQRHHYLTH